MKELQRNLSLFIFSVCCCFLEEIWLSLRKPESPTRSYTLRRFQHCLVVPTGSADRQTWIKPLFSVTFSLNFQTVHFHCRLTLLGQQGLALGAIHGFHLEMILKPGGS